jgi:hypothetical protein
MNARKCHAFANQLPVGVLLLKSRGSDWTQELVLAGDAGTCLVYLIEFHKCKIQTASLFCCQAQIIATARTMSGDPLLYTWTI